MIGFLLDTNVLSEFGRSANPPDAKVKRWVESVLPSKKRSELEQWLDSDLNGWFGNNLLPVTKAISNRWGTLAASMQQRGKPTRFWRQLRSNMT